MKPVTKTKPWRQLTREAKRMPNFNLRKVFAKDPGRAVEYVFEAADLQFDYSRHLVDSKILAQLFALAEKRKLQMGVERMFRGDHLNLTEDRAVLHTALRRPGNDSLIVDGQDVVSDVHQVLDRMTDFALAVREGRFLGSTGRPVTAIVNIGIGGSDLGPVMAFEALKAYTQRNLTFRFVSNVDEADLQEALIGLDPETTLFIVASKTFTTSETMTNANSAKHWLESQLGDRFVPQAHFAALSTNGKLVSDFGVAPANVFGFWDWVGGRFSMESAIGLSTMIAIGPEAYREMLDGFYRMDRYLLDTPIRQNAIYWSAMLSVWYRNFLGAQSSAVLPYDNYLKRLPAYLQQLLMESNGKRVDLQGRPVKFETSAIYWGEPGTNGQHSFHQLLHQGTSLVPVDFMVAARPIAELGNHHELLISNVLAQASVLAFGRTLDEVIQSGTEPKLAPHKVMPGNRPSTLVTYAKLTPSVLGQIVSFYEHVTLLQGLIWGIGSFDQWGVELGKNVATEILPVLSGGNADKLDGATAASVMRLRKLMNR